jgi:hypothetical protein
MMYVMVLLVFISWSFLANKSSKSRAILGVQRTSFWLFYGALDRRANLGLFGLACFAWLVVFAAVGADQLVAPVAPCASGNADLFATFAAFEFVLKHRNPFWLVGLSHCVR